MRVWVLGSGSRGNAVLVDSAGTRVLIDAGFGPRTLAARLKLAGVDARSVAACVVTHDHSDHVRGAAKAALRWGWQLFATAGTAAAPDLARVHVTTFAHGDTVRVGSFEVHAVATPHDAAEPVGVVITALASGARAAICYDIGHGSDGVRTLCQSVDVLVLEANHDEGMLWAGPYPPWLCKRIASNTGHLSNRAAGEVARDVVSPQLAHLVLAHLSEKNNTPTLADRTIRSALRATSFRGKLTTTQQDAVTGPFTPRGFTSRPEPAVQLAFAL
ncbi:MAG: MBL fold metallo-hydrolase [Gemmatimonadaceae bacterium]